MPSGIINFYLHSTHVVCAARAIFKIRAAASQQQFASFQTANAPRPLLRPAARVTALPSASSLISALHNGTAASSPPSKPRCRPLPALEASEPRYRLFPDSFFYSPPSSPFSRAHTTALRAALPPQSRLQAALPPTPCPQGLRAALLPAPRVLLSLPSPLSRAHATPTYQVHIGYTISLNSLYKRSRSLERTM